MAEEEKEIEEIEEDIGGEDGEESEDGAPKKSNKKLLIILVIVILGLGGGGFAIFSGILDSGSGSGHSEEEENLLKSAVIYLDIDEFLVNLNNNNGQVNFLKMTVTFELPNLKTQSAVESNMPRIRDSLQVYLRELRSSDLQGSTGIHRLREELLLRVNKIIQPLEVTDILFKEIMVQ